MEDRGALYLCDVWRIEEHFNCVLSNLYKLLRECFNLLRQLIKYDEVSERKVVQLLWSVGLFIFIFPISDGEGPKDNKHERRRTSAMMAVPPRLNPLRKHSRTASCVSSGRYSSHNIYCQATEKRIGSEIRMKIDFLWVSHFVQAQSSLRVSSTQYTQSSEVDLLVVAMTIIIIIMV